MLFALVFIIIIASCGTIFANSIDGTAENLFTNEINDLSINSLKINDNSIDNINQVKNSKNTAEFTDDHFHDSNKPVMENLANHERDNSPNKINNEIIGDKANSNVVVINTTAEKDVDKLLSTGTVASSIATNNQNLKNNSSSGVLAAGDNSTLFSRSSILTAATNVKKFVEKHGKLPNYVTIANKQVSMNEFLYLLTKSIVNINKKISSGMRWEDVRKPNKPSGNSINANLDKNSYITLAQNVIKFIEKNGQAPNFGVTSRGKVQYQTMIYAFARILDFTRKNGYLPNYVTLNTKNPANLNKVIPTFESNVESRSFTGLISVSLANITDAAARVEAFYYTNNVLPMYVTISGIQFSMAEFLYMAAISIVNIDKNVKKDIDSISVINPIKQNGNSKEGEIHKNNYVDLASRVSTYIAKNGQAPNFGESTLGNIEFKLLVLGFSKILSFENNNSVLPNHVTLIKSGSIKDNPLSIPANSLNDRYNGECLGSFLVASPNCQVNDSAIRALAIELTKGHTTEWDKAESIFNYVRDNIAYEFYYNTKHGAKNTLNRKAGNCVDQSHLLIALARSIGLAARYVNGQSTFITSGNTIGHVWVQIKVGDTWVVADTTSRSNNLGAIKNWYTNTVKIHGTYASINF